MPTPPISREVLEEAVDLYASYSGNISAAARASGIPRPTLQGRLARAREMGLIEGGDIRDKGDFIAPHIPRKQESPVERWERRRKEFAARRRHFQAREWMCFTMKRVEPCAILWFGDPHLDDDGCDLEALERAIAVGNQPNVYSVGIGDYQNNWIGRLARLYGHQETGQKAAWQDVAYFVQDCGLTWLTLIKGNHDLWSGKGDPLDFIADGVSDLANWRAQFRLRWSNGAELRVDAAHDHKGHSQWSDSFGAKKTAYLDGRAHLYVCGHKHTASLDRFRHPHRGSQHETFRVRGFKYFDQYAIQNGFPEQSGSEAMMTVINPTKVYEDGSPSFRTFDCVDEGAEYLAFKRGST